MSHLTWLDLSFNNITQVGTDGALSSLTGLQLIFLRDGPLVSSNDWISKDNKNVDNPFLVIISIIFQILTPRDQGL